MKKISLALGMFLLLGTGCAMMAETDKNKTNKTSNTPKKISLEKANVPKYYVDICIDGLTYRNFSHQMSALKFDSKVLFQADFQQVIAADGKPLTCKTEQ